MFSTFSTDPQTIFREFFGARGFFEEEERDFSSGVIDNSEGVLKCVNSLYSNSELSDVVFVVGEERIHAHRLLLAARSEYFRSMLYGGLKESIEDEVVLSGTDPAASTALLRYLYTGRLSIRRVEHKQLVDILCLAHEYQLKCIQDDLVAYFKRTLNIRNYFLTLNTAMMLSIDNLTERCLKFADYNCHDVLNSQDFNALPLKTLTRMLSRDTFCAPELDIFNALCRWAEYETKIGGTALEMLLNGLISKGCLRLALIDVDDLLNVVRSSILFSSNADIFDKYILDAISNKRNETKINFRGTLIRDTNIVTVEHGASVMVGIEPDALLSSNEKSGATRHKFGSQEGIVIDLGKPYTINTVVLKLNESDTKRTFSYYIEVSMDRKSWVMVADRTKYQCRSLQTLYFHPCLVRYIRVVGTACSASIQEFLLMGMEGLFSTTPSKVNSETTLIVPSANIAIAENNVRVIEGSGKVDFFNGKANNYAKCPTTWHKIKNGSTVIQFPQPYIIPSLRFLLMEGRKYSYMVEVSTDCAHWTVVCNRNEPTWSGWQTVKLARAVPVTFVRISGKGCASDTEYFEMYYFECPSPA